MVEPPGQTLEKPVTAYWQADDLRSRAGRALQKIPSDVRYAILLFCVSRAVLTVIGILAYGIVAKKDISTFPDILSMWSVWDSTWYLDIARNGYSTVMNSANMANYNFLPLYPLAMRPLGFLLDNFTFAGLIVSNACIFISCLYLYRLMGLDGDEPAAKRSIKYLFLFPSAFILSGILSESIFLAVTLACFYYTKKRDWPLAGVAGFLASLARPYGVIIVLPVAYEYLKSVNFKPSNIKADVLCLLAVPAGIGLFAAYNYMLTGDFLAFAHVAVSWGHRFVLPYEELPARLMSSSMDVRFGGYFALLSLLFLVVFYRKLDLSYLLYGLLVIFIPLCTAASAWSMARYILPVFPLYIVFAKLGKNPDIDQALTIGMALLQGMLMVTWTMWGYFIV